MTGVDIPLLDVKKLAYLLVEGYWQVSVVDEIDSTQTYLAQKNKVHGEVISAEYQSAGRGRRDRTFEANKSQSLLFSLYIEPKRNREEWGWIPLIAGVSLAQIVNQKSSFFKTKWPNDLLAVNSPAEGKVAGILAETSGDGVIVGVGINVAMDKADLPVPTATSLSLLGLSHVDRNELLAQFLTTFAGLLKRWEKGEDLSALYLEGCATIDRDVEIHGAGGEIERGTARGIGPFGELILEGDRHIYSGDVIHLYT